jgi:hypothetical protein
MLSSWIILYQLVNICLNLLICTCCIYNFPPCASLTPYKAGLSRPNRYLKIMLNMAGFVKKNPGRQTGISVARRGIEPLLPG